MAKKKAKRASKKASKPKKKGVPKRSSKKASKAKKKKSPSKTARKPRARRGASPLPKTSQAPVPARPKKVKKISKSQWASFERRLLEMREDLVGIVQNKEARDVGETVSGDEADIASRSVEKEILFELNDNERSMLDQIEAALRRIEKGTFGVCEGCREPIDAKRIQALPFARFCIRCQSSHESAVVF